jgi:hypothetical protein
MTAAQICEYTFRERVQANRTVITAGRDDREIGLDVSDGSEE